MPKHLVIVESPAKAKTINKYLGRDYQVLASMGHVRDLPKSKLGVDVEADFKPHYITIRTRSKVLKELKSAAAQAKDIYLAPDPDREGEAIAWHLAHELAGKKHPIYRITFNEITKKAVKEALEKPHAINQAMVDAQQARRILDRLVGYSISPLLWKKVRKGLSAGRVQSVAVRLVVDREREIQAFVPEEYWRVEVDLASPGQSLFTTLLTHIRGEKARVRSADEAATVRADLERAHYRITQLEKKEQRRYPAPPFITSKLQQEAANKLGFTAKKTMLLAQQLYEGIELGSAGPVGLITYMRTDSVRVSEDAQREAKAFLEGQYGKDFVPEAPPRYKSKKNVQDAHEAIRPTMIDGEAAPEKIKKHLTPDQFKLYQLIWRRFLASQMTPALFDAASAEVTAGEYTLKATGSVMKFPGFTVIYTEHAESPDEADPAAPTSLPPDLAEGQECAFRVIRPEQKFTQPPARYNDASLVKALEENNIGRPSTYAPILGTILQRDYIQREQGRFHPTELGFLINDLLVENFPDILNIEFTAGLEDELDEIETGHKPWVEVLRKFYQSFQGEVDKAAAGMKDIKAEMEQTVYAICDQCGSNMVVKWGRHGKFIACTNYPACKNTKPIDEGPNGEIRIKTPETVDEACPQCAKPLLVKFGRFGKFLACSGYPECKFTKPAGQPAGIACPKPGCTGTVVQRRSKRGRVFYGCNRYPQCDFLSWDKPVAQVCPQCQHPYLVEKYSKKRGAWLACPQSGCGYEATNAPAPEAENPQ
jgi:DNA topoisomerase-1